MALIALYVDAGASVSPGKTDSSPRKLSVTLRPFDCLCHEQRGFVQGGSAIGRWRTRMKLPPGFPACRADSWFVNICDVRHLRPSGVGTDAKTGFLRRMQGMQMDGGDKLLLGPVTERIFGCAFRVANALGHGFVEKVYEDALAHKMRKCRLGVVQQWGIVAFYDDVIVGEYTADLLVEDQVIVELKVVGALSDVHLPQCRNDLRATGKPPWQVHVPTDQFRPA